MLICSTRMAERGGEVVGYSYAGPHRDRDAYRWSVDVSAYVHPSVRRTGVASSMYRSLLAVLEAQGFHSAFAGIALPNDASIALHRAFQFELEGIYREVGYKLGAWRNTAWWRRTLNAAASRPRNPVPISEFRAGGVSPRFLGT